METIVFHVEIVDPETNERRVTVERWPREIAIDAVVLKQADPDLMRIDDDVVTFTVDNGQAVYRVGDFSQVAMVYQACLVSARLTDA